MALPKLLQKLFANSGAGPLLRSDIIPVDSALSDTSTNAVQNKIIASKFEALATVATSGSYNDLANRPTIPSAVTVDSALSSTSTNPLQNKAIYAALAAKANTSVLATVATSGSYNDLLNRPTISSGITVVAESYTSSSWYRKYSDGWIEQGVAGTVKATGSGTTVNFPIAFSTACYGASSLRGNAPYTYNDSQYAVSLGTPSKTGIVIYSGGAYLSSTTYAYNIIAIGK